MKFRLANRCLLAGMVTLSSVTSQAADLDVAVEGLRSRQGQLIVTLYSTSTRQAFPKNSNGALKRQLLPLQEGPMVVHFEDLPDGAYAVSIVHDENANGTMDHNWLGLPKEGYGFSRDPKIRMSLPSFDDAAVQIAGKPLEVHIPVHY